MWQMGEKRSIVCWPYDDEATVADKYWRSAVIHRSLHFGLEPLTVTDATKTDRFEEKSEADVNVLLEDDCNVGLTRGVLRKRLKKKRSRQTRDECGDVRIGAWRAQARRGAKEVW
jgi:hypothetical protein